MELSGVYLIDPDTAAGTAVNVGGIPGAPNSGPVRVAATSAQTIFVGLAAYGGGGSGCSNCLAQMNLAASPVTVEPAPQPQVAALTSAPLLDASSDGSTAFFSFATVPGQPMAGWAATAPRQFLTAQTNIPATDVAAAADGTLFASRNSGIMEIRDASLALRSVTATSELEQIPHRTEVPGVAPHPSGALVYAPFLAGPAPISAPFTGLQGENGQRIFVLTASGLTVLQLASVPLGIGTISPASGPASGGTTITIRGSGLQAGASVTIGRKAVTTTFVDINTLKIITPVLSAAAQSIAIANSDAESVSWDAAFTAN